MTSTTDANNVTRTFEYDANGNQNKTTQVVNGETIVTETIYNAAGQVTSTVDPEGHTSSTLYNAIGKPCQTTDKLGNVTKTYYDTRGNIVKTEYPDGTISCTAYDANGRGYITQDRHIPGNAELQLGSRTFYNAIGQAVRSERLANVAITVTTDDTDITKAVATATVDLSGATEISHTLTEYDRAGRTIKSTATNGAISRNEYDNAGRTLAVIDTLGNRTSYTYNAAGQQTIATDALGRETKFEYDALGRRVRTSFADNTFTAVEYNTLGQKIKETDQAGISTLFAYNTATDNNGAIGRLKSVTKPPVDNGSGTLVSPVYFYTYDNYGRQIEITDPLNRKTTFTYDKYGRQKTRTMPSGQSESQEYNTLGQLKTKTDFKGQTTLFEYDNYGRLANKLFYAVGEEPDNGGTASEAVEIDYDDLGRQSKITKTVAGITTRETTYSYNSLNQLEQISTPEGDVNYEYNPKTGQKTGVTSNTTGGTATHYTYDELGRLKTVTDKDGGMTTYSYTAVGSRESVTLPNGITTNYTYNDLNRLTNLTHKNSSDELLSSYTYTLAPNGRRTAVAEQSRTAAPALSPLYNRNITYQYDTMNRLVAETSTCDDTNQPELTYTSEYSYDLTGNRKNYSVTNDSVTTAVSYSYNDNDQLVSETKTSTGNPSVVTLYEYDNNGSQLSKVSGTGDSYYYSYNLQNRLSTAIINRTEGSTTVALTTDYTYNQSGIRVRAKSTPSGSSLTTEKAYLIDAGLTGYAQVLEEKEINADDSTTLIKSYTLGDDVISQTSIHNSSFITHNFLYDGHGSTRLLTDTNGTIAETYNYNAYGKNLFDTSNTETNLLYSGEQFDNNLQMQYLRARYYDQNNGTFNRLDPYSGNNYDPQSLHKYAYTHNDPVNGIDPSGKSTTMIETLSSVTIIAIMAVALLPALSDHKRRAESTALIRSLFQELIWIFMTTTATTTTVPPTIIPVDRTQAEDAPIPIPIPLSIPITDTTTQRRNPKKQIYLHYSHMIYAPMLIAGLRPMSYATRMIYLIGWDAKLMLALPTITPPNAVYAVIPKPGYGHTYEGPVKPMKDYAFRIMPGGGYEYRFDKGSGGPGTVFPPYPLPMGTPLLTK